MPTSVRHFRLWSPFPYVYAFPLPRVVGVGQLASHTALPSSPFVGAVPTLAPSLWSRVVGVGHGDEVEALPDVRCADASSAQIGRPDGVACAFQVSRYSVEPRPASRSRNLLAKEDCRAALADELEQDGPEVAVVVEAALLSGG